VAQLATGGRPLTGATAPGAPAPTQLEPLAPMPSLATAPAASAAPGSSMLDTILREAELALGVIAEVAPIIPGAGTMVGGGSALASKILALVQAGVTAHESVTGKTLDLSVLQHIAPL
jgi:hypothetical protein